MTDPSTESARSPATPSIEAERRQITVLFSDLVEFTPIAEKLGDEDTYELIRRLTEEQESIIGAHGGTIQDFAGDGIMAVFGAPLALEDAPLRACRAALDVQSRMRAMRGELSARYGVAPDIRIGINTGTAVVGKMGESRAAASSALGNTVNVAARLQSTAEPGTVVISSTTQGLVAPFTQTTPLGERHLKGRSTPEAAFRLDAIRKGVARFEASRQKGLTDLIGRAHELRVLQAEWEKARAGALAVVDIVGEAGIGKSRLIHEFVQAMPQPGQRILQGQCLSDSATPFAPFIEVLQDSFDIEEGTTGSDIEQRLRSGLETLDLDPATTLPYLLNLLGQSGVDQVGGLAIPPEVVGVRTRRALGDIIERQCHRSAVALIIEDLHWIDTASQELLQSMSASPTLGGILIVGSYRPSYTPLRAGAVNGTVLHLEPLSSANLIDLVKARLGTDDLPEKLVQLVVARSDGNPLFAEELTSYLVYKGMVNQTTAGLRLDPAFNPAELPATLENLLMDRVDHLAEGPRAIIRVASVVGRRFASSVVQESGGLNGHFNDDLARLNDDELVFPDAESTYSDHVFKHALVRDAVYRTLLRSDREELHRRVASAIERRYSDKIDEVSDVLAHHFSNGQVTAKAVRYMASAGRRALKLMSLDEADLRLRQVVDIVENEPDIVSDELFADVLIDLMHLTCWRYDFAGMLAISQRYLPRVEGLGESRQLSRFLQWTGEALLCAGRFDEADVALCRALRLGEKLGDKESEMFALWDLVWLCSVRPDDRPNDYIGKSGRKVLEYADELDDYYHKMTSRYTLSADCLERGYLTEADAWAQELLAFGRESGYGPATSVGSMFRALCFALRGEFDQARELSEESIKRAVSEIERALGMGVKGLVLTLQGEFDEACELLAYVRTVAHEETFQVLLTTVEIPYGAALAFSGRVEEGVGILLDAVDMFSRWRNSRMVAWANLVLGQIYLHGSMAHAGARAEEAMSGFDDARRHLEQAVRIGRAAGTDGHVVEALLNLGLLAKTCARPDDARTHLEEAFGLVGRLGWPDLTQRVESALADL